MIFPITLPQWTYNNAVRHRNIVYKIGVSDIAALELHRCRAAGCLKVGEAEGPEPFGEIVTNSMTDIDEALRKTFSQRVRDLGAPRASEAVLLQA